MSEYLGPGTFLGLLIGAFALALLRLLWLILVELRKR